MSAGKIIIVIGSPRKRGNSATLAHRVADGAKAAGADVEIYYLHYMDIIWTSGRALLAMSAVKILPWTVILMMT